MPSPIVTEAWNIEIGAQEQWPQPIQLFQPYEVEQILLPDNTNCLATQAFLKMCNLEFQIEPRWNAEFMSPSLKVPFIKCGAYVVPDFDDIVAFIRKRGSSLSENLTLDEKVSLRAYMSLVNNVLYNAELYVCWYHDETYKNITKERHGSVYPWPLNCWLNWQKRSQVIKSLSIFGWTYKTLDQVFNEVKKCCQALSDMLGKKTYFFGDTPTQLDALVFGHVHILTTSNFPIPIQELARLIRRYPLLINHTYFINKQYFNRTPNLANDSFVSSDELLQDTFDTFNNMNFLFSNE